MSRIYALNAPELPILIVGVIAAMLQGAIFPTLAVLFAEVLAVRYVISLVSSVYIFIGFCNSFYRFLSSYLSLSPSFVVFHCLSIYIALGSNIILITYPAIPVFSPNLFHPPSFSISLPPF